MRNVEWPNQVSLMPFRFMSAYSSLLLLVPALARGMVSGELAFSINRPT